MFVHANVTTIMLMLLMFFKHIPKKKCFEHFSTLLARCTVGVLIASECCYDVLSVCCYDVL